MRMAIPAGRPQTGELVVIVQMAAPEAIKK